jgi:hypothetical protein
VTATPPAAPTPAGSIAPGTNCTGASNATNLTFWTTDTANHEPFAVYCGVVGSPWYFNGAHSTWGNNGLVTAEYKTTKGGLIDVQEGAVSSDFCASTTGTIGSAKFGPTFSGTLYTTTGGFALCAASGVYKYQVKGSGVTQSTFTAIAAAMAVVPKS